MKTLLYILVAGCLAIGACKGRGAEQTAKPGELTTLQWIDSVKDMGKINEGQVIDIAYRFKNTGTKPLVIKNVNVSCGCTVAEKPEAPIAPGQEGEIKASFNSTGKAGSNTKSIYVYANTVGTGAHELKFMVEVAKKPE
jgi:hypothetical protein